MKSARIALGLASLLGAAAIGPLAQAQPYDQGPAQNPPDYQQRQQQYQDDQSQYRDRTEAYDSQQRAYEGQRGRYERERADYDARYGEGAFDHYYRSRPDAYDERYGADAYARDFGGPPPAPPYERRAYDTDRDYRDSPCEQRAENRAVAGGVIGALAGAALGSNIGAGPGREGGAIIGAVLGGAVGAGIGHSSAQCDGRGYYFSYADTYPYREGEWEHGASGAHDYDWYRRNRCRLATAPAHVQDRDEYRYVRVCPDDQGRYRFTE